MEVYSIYFGWWGPGVWERVGTFFTPVLGYYDSLKDDVIKQHLRWAESADIHAFLCSWWGVMHQTNTQFNKMLKFFVPSTHPKFKLAVFYERRDGVVVDDVVNDLKYILDFYGNHQNYLRINDQPAIFVYGQAIAALTVEGWRQVIETLSREGYMFFIVASVDFTGGDDAIPVFDGIFQFDIWSLYTREAIEAEHQRLASLAQSAGKLFISTVAPGFDNRNFPGGGLVVDREDGKFYADTWEIAKKYSNFINISTFNEWWESSNIEPALEFSPQEKYLLMTKGRGVEVPPPPCFIATVAYGSVLAPQLDVLRKFRDRCLPELVVKTYYRLSPPLAFLIEKSAKLRLATRTCLKPVIKLLKR